MLELVFALGWELAKYEIGELIIKEFIARGLGEVYAKKIEEWQKYKKEKKFAKKLDKQMKKEIERFTKTIKKWKPKELEETIIEGLKG